MDAYAPPPLHSPPPRQLGALLAFLAQAIACGPTHCPNYGVAKRIPSTSQDCGISGTPGQPRIPNCMGHLLLTSCIGHHRRGGDVHDPFFRFHSAHLCIFSLISNTRITFPSWLHCGTILMSRLRFMAGSAPFKDTHVGHMSHPSWGCHLILMASRPHP